MNNTGVKSRLGQETDWNRVRFLPWTDSVSLSFFFFFFSFRWSKERDDCVLHCTELFFERQFREV